jgi:hypothetical protein
VFAAHLDTDLFSIIENLSIAESIFIKQLQQYELKDEISRATTDLNGANDFSILMSFPIEIPLNE